MTPTTRKITLYWLLLLLPTLLAGAGAFYLLRREQARIAEQASMAELARRSAIESRAQLVAENVALLVDDVQRGLLDTLRTLPAKNLDASLAEWEATNPLVRTTFISRPDGELLRPKSNGTATDEGREFSRRFARLLKVVPPWNAQMSASQAAPVMMTEPVVPASAPAPQISPAKTAPQLPVPAAVAQQKIEAQQALAQQKSAETKLNVVSSESARSNVLQYSRAREEARSVANQKIASVDASADKKRETSASGLSSYASKTKVPAKKTELRASSSLSSLAPTSAEAAKLDFRDQQSVELERTKEQTSGALAKADELLAEEKPAAADLKIASVEPLQINALAAVPEVKVAQSPAAGGVVGRADSNLNRLADTAAAPAPAVTGTLAQNGAKEVFRADAFSEDEAPAVFGADRSGWVPWFADNSLHLLGWHQPSGSGKVRGLEIELNALIARMSGLLPLDEISGVTFGLRDDAGRVLHTVGAPLRRSDPKPQVRIELTEALPNWEVVAWFGAGQGALAPGASGFLFIGSLLVGILLVAILAGGSLLLWQARRSEAEAVQKTTFVANVSHEFKTPLTTIRMYAELLAQGRVRDEAKQVDYLQTIGRETQRLARLVGNVLDFSRLEQGRKKFQIEPVKLAELVTRVVDEQRPRLDEAGVRVELSLPEMETTARTDRDAVEQVLLNLIDNAVKYAASGGEVSVELKAAGGGWELSVADRGSGVPASQREKIFEKFHRVDETLTAEKGGAGLGLSIAQQLARGLGGDLRYEARVGGGAVFVFSIPQL